LICNAAKSIFCKIIQIKLFLNLYLTCLNLNTSAKRFFVCTIIVFINYNIHEYIFTWNANYFNFYFYFFNYCRLLLKIVYPSQYAIKYRFARISICQNVVYAHFTAVNCALLHLRFQMVVPKVSVDTPTTSWIYSQAGHKNTRQRC